MPARAVSGTMTLRSAAMLALVMTAAACSPGGVPSPSPKVIPGPTGDTALGPAELRLVLVDQLGPLWYCDRDSYPVGRDEQQGALDAWPEMQAEHELLRAIAERLAIDVDAEVADTDKLALYRQWKMGLAVQLESIDEGEYRFDYLARPRPGASEGTRTVGTIRDTGQITIEQQAAAGEPTCPICLALGSPIDTPTGPIPIERLRLGDRVWTLDAAGGRVVGTVIALGSAPAPPEHEVIRLELQDGRTVTASSGHPLADGRPIGAARAGDMVDGSLVARVTRLPYGLGATYDLAVSGETGWYLSDGIPLASTLARR